MLRAEAGSGGVAAVRLGWKVLVSGRESTSGSGPGDEEVGSGVITCEEGGVGVMMAYV